MKRKILFAALLTSLAVLVACDRNKNPKTNDKPQTDTIVETPVQNDVNDDHCIAFRVFENIPKDHIDKAFRYNTYTCSEDSPRHFSITTDQTSCNVHCFQLDQGGWLAVMVTEYCFDGCKQVVQTYNFDHDLLSFAVNPLPRVDDMTLARNAVKALGEVSEEDLDSMEAEEIDYLVSNMEVSYLYHFQGDKNVSVLVEACDSVGDVIFSLPEELYKWNGSKFLKTY